MPTKLYDSDRTVISYIAKPSAPRCCGMLLPGPLGRKFDAERSYIYIRENSFEYNKTTTCCVKSVCCCVPDTSITCPDSDSVTVQYFDRMPFTNPKTGMGCCATPEVQSTIELNAMGKWHYCCCCGGKSGQEQVVIKTETHICPCVENKWKSTPCLPFCLGGNCGETCGPLTGNTICYQSFPMQPNDKEMFVEQAHLAMARSRKGEAPVPLRMNRFEMNEGVASQDVGAIVIAHEAKIRAMPQPCACLLNTFKCCFQWEADMDRSYVRIREHSIETNNATQLKSCFFSTKKMDSVTIQYFDRPPFVNILKSKGCCATGKEKVRGQVELYRHGKIMCGCDKPGYPFKTSVTVVPYEELDYLLGCCRSQNRVPHSCFSSCFQASYVGNPISHTMLPVQPLDSETFVEELNEAIHTRLEGGDVSIATTTKSRAPKSMKMTQARKMMKKKKTTTTKSAYQSEAAKLVFAEIAGGNAEGRVSANELVGVFKTLYKVNKAGVKAASSFIEELDVYDEDECLDAAAFGVVLDRARAASGGGGKAWSAVCAYVEDTAESLKRKHASPKGSGRKKRQKKSI